MSEEINSSHLCTTEDAFEKFQAVSMYQEDEYITLSDIVPAQTQAPDLMGEICDIPYEDEVVLESNLVDQVFEVNSTMGSGIDENKSFEPVDEHLPNSEVAEEVVVGEQDAETFEAGPNNVPEEGHNNAEAGHNDITLLQHQNHVNEEAPSEVAKNTAQSNPSRRGRKKKIPTEIPPAGEPNDDSKHVKTIAQEYSEKDLNTSGQRRRGRPPKNVTNQSTITTTPLKEEHQNENISQNSTVKKRGRPRKAYSNQQVSEPTSSSEADCQDVNKNIENVAVPKTDYAAKSPVKRGKRMRLLSSEKSESDLNESKAILDQNNSDSAQKHLNQKVPGKRGRKSKKVSDKVKLNGTQQIHSSDTDLETVKTENQNNNDDDDADDICLSKLKTSLDSNEPTISQEAVSEVSENEKIKEPKINEFTMDIEISEENAPDNDLDTLQDKTEAINSESNSLMPEMTDFEENIDKIVSAKKEQAISENENVASYADPNSLLVEDTSKRPTRRRTRKPLQYDEGSDEDPFANIELSDDEPIGCKKKYYSDDEYIPGKNKKGKQSDSSESDSDIDMDNIEDELLENKRKRSYKKSESSPIKGAKKGRKSVNEKAADIIPPDNKTSIGESGNDDDIEICLKPSIIKTNEDKKNKDIESFLAKKIHGTDIQIKKKSTVQPFEIPVIDPKEQKKTAENSSQTNKVLTTSAGVQTMPVYDIPMKDNVMLTSEQSEKACEFLNSIVKTTAELGELMTQKSQDFMKKKINTDHVTDTFKMDYCVRKSFLLFKLAKHNLMQMEEDLTKQYDTFLSTHNLQQHREQPKVVTAAPKTEGSDSDCEIIDTPVIQKPQKKKPVAFNPKTVFLNKELSIKIAKKTPTKDTKPESKKIDIKGRHTVWINDSVMVKKVKPTQSFLAQDSRNKKPPDYVTIEMVNSFFKQCYRRKAVTACAPYVSTEWLTQKSNVCCYFFANTESISVSTEVPSSSNQCTVVNGNSDTNENLIEQRNQLNPKTLFSLCTQVLQNYLSNKLVKTNDVVMSITPKLEHNPQSLYWLCLNAINMSNVGANDNVCPLPTTSQHQESVHHNDATCASLTTSQYQEKYLDNDFLSALPLLDEEAYENSECSSPLSLLDQEEGNGGDKFVSSFILSNQEGVNKEPEFALPLSLKTLCYNQTVKQMFIKDKIDNQATTLHDLNWNKLILNLDSVNEIQTFLNDVKYQEDEDFLLASPLLDQEADEDAEYSSPMFSTQKTCRRNGIKSLSSLCFDLINSCMIEELVVSKHIECKSVANKVPHIPKTLKCLTFMSIVNLLYTNENLTIVKSTLLLQKIKSLSNICFEIITKSFLDSQDSPLHDGLTINSINTMTEEAYHNIQHAELPEDLDYYEDDDDSNFYDDRTESCVNNSEDDSDRTQMNNWLSQVQMQELRSCYTPNIPLETETNLQEATNNVVEEQHLLARVKVEPAEEFQENIDSSITVKTEHLSHHPDEMTIIPENIITKTEYEDAPASSSAPIQRQNSSSYDVDTFEAFVASNKMMHNHNDDEIFSQSALRVRRQFEPDDLSENDMGMSLLIPQTFEPLRIENNAKDCLMESSSDESTNSKKVPGKKKTEKRPRGKPKKNESKTSNNKGPVIVPPKEKASVTNEIAILTRRMREKIRQEEKKVVSSESENESEAIVTKKSKQKEEKNKAKSSKILEDDKDSPTTAELEKRNPADSEIQCSNVDSTEQINEGRNSSPSINNFTGFTAVDQNEISSYQKYVKYVYDQILPRVTEQADPNCQDREDQPVINPEDPVELLECEPSMPYFPEEPAIVTRRPGPKTKTQNKESIKALSKDENKIKTNENCIERHGWHCYPLDGNDTKLYQNAQIVLEKLPESFVQTYFMYQDVASNDNEDDEVNRLINLQTLNRSAIKDGKSNKGKLRSKNADKISDQLGIDNIDKQGSISPTFSENADELTPSEDEGGRIEDELPPPVKPTSDNNLAKNSLMDDNDSDADESGVSKVKDEPLDEYDNPIKSRSKKSKSKAKAIDEIPGPVMLTADKMMNKELNLLHAPINLDDTVEPTPSKGRTSKHKQKSASKTSPKENVKAENDSSEEEEKHQWFTIKEKLLKRMVKKSDTTREDDAKRAKLVSEFIERRGDSSEAYIKRRGGRGSRRISKKKMLERQKQLKVLSHELFGDACNDASLYPKRSQQAYFKGRRNIRKVIDKKSLARSTVVANMEEFERKRRINIRQSRLREIMQCEEGVNVLVINDEVCLEYDFEAHRPVVTIHPFFTKVMKAHQYEGVKFMWDACFESLESIAAGQPGGGCILAHCMGLGKTLQVLALLHTVLTHSRVGMQRVLVCCPLSTVLNWVDEIHKWIGPVTNQIKVFELSKLKKTSNRAYQLEDWYNGGGIFIIGYELFRSLSTLDPFLDNVRPAVVKKIRTALLDPGPDIIICDEGHLLKNDCSVLAVAMSRVVTKRRIVLTGTPMQNNLREYYCMVNFVKPNLLGTYSEYSNRFENPIMNGQHRDSREEDIKLMKARTHILHKVLEGCLQRQEASVLYPYLPKKHEYTVFISLTQCQWDLYKHYLQNYSNTQNNKSVLKDFHILQKIWSHPQVLHNFQNRTGETTRNKVKEEKLEDDLAREDLNATEDIKPNTDTEVWWLQYLEDGAMLDSLASSNKFVAVFRILEESIALNDKVLIFSTSLFTMDSLEYFLKKINNWSLGQEYYRLDGSVPAEVRQKWCREFNAENNHKTKLFLISTRAGCLGLNMTAANRVIILDTSWNPAHDIQSIFRVYRFGQKKDCYIYRLVALGTMEQKIYERSVTKQAVACRVVDEQQIDRHYNMAELTELYKYDETGAGVAGGVAVGVEDVVLLRVARDAALHAVHEHDSLLRGSLEQGLPEHERDAAWVQFQEEHAHKQQMQEMVAPVKIKKVKVKMPTQPQYTPPVEPPNVPAVPDGPIKTETDESILPNDPEYTPDQRPKPKGRKGRPSKSNIVSCCIPIQPEAPEAPEVNEPASADEDMIKKITHILLKYNYQNNQGPKEIAELVSRVRGLVYSGKMDQLDNSDELTMSIARVLLGRSPKEPMPPLTDIAEDVRNEVQSEIKQETVETPVGRPRRSRSRKTKKGYVYETVPSTSTRPEPDADGQRRRRAALAAEKNFESPPVGDPVVDLGPMVDDSRDNEFLPELPIEYDAADSDSSGEIVFSNVEIKKETDVEVKTGKRPLKAVPKTYENIQAKQKKNETPQPSESQSILLSDDDEPPPPLVKRKPGPARKTIKTEKIESPASSKDSEVVPLHPSLLSNKNFIKIVAHTYLSGNPMLDEDAATLAAQYSTFKALKEYEANEKSIDSGPIYDIATKVLGVDVLRKLHKSNVKISTSDILAQHPINSQEGAPGQGPVLKQALNAQDKKATETTDKNRRKQSLKPDPEPTVQESRSLLKVTSEAAPKSKLPKLAPKPQVAAPVVPEPSAPGKKPMGIKVRLPGALNSTPYSMPLTSVTSSPANVVPVGLFKRAADTPGETQSDECILPDDDDIRIVTDPAPATPTAPATPLSIAASRNVHPIALTVTADTHAYPTPPPAPAGTIPGEGSAVGRNYGTIDITSDDEDTPAPAPAQPYAYAASSAPVPVSLSAVRPSDLPPHLRPAPRPPRILRRVVAPPTRTAPLLLNSVADVPAGATPVVSSAGQYILVPTSSLTRVLPVVPVSLDQVRNNPQAASQPLLAHPLPTTDLTSGIPFDSNVANPPIEVVGAEQTVETTDPVAKGGKRLCKPGDILRITKGGAIEVLNRKDITDMYPKNKQEVAATPPPPPDATVQTRRLRGSAKFAPKPEKTVTAEKKIDHKVTSRSVESTPITPTAPPERTSTGFVNRTGSSNVVAARSPSPSDIFKNVVHIAADDYVSLVDDSPSPSALEKKPTDTQVSAPLKKPAATSGSASSKTTSQGKWQSTSTAKTPASTAKTSTSTKPAVSNTTLSSSKTAMSNAKPSTSTTKSSSSTAKPSTPSTRQSSSTAKPSTSSAKPSTSSAKPSTSSAKPSTSTAKPSTSTAKPSTSNTKTPAPSNTQKSLASTKGTAANKPKEPILDLVDLTDLDYVPPTPVSTKKKSQPNTIVGTSKSIILCSSGKAVSKPLAPKTTTSAKTAPKVDKAEVKKRPAPADNSSAKKKKTDKPMTLKDFDIDDIDDIIELD